MSDAEQSSEIDPTGPTCDWCDETEDLDTKDVANEETGETRTGLFCPKHRRKIEQYQADETADLEIEA